MKHCVVSRLPKTCFGEASGEDGLPCLVITESILVPRKDVGIYVEILHINGYPESTTKTPAVKLARSSELGSPNSSLTNNQSKHCGSNNHAIYKPFLRNTPKFDPTFDSTSAAQIFNWKILGEPRISSELVAVHKALFGQQS